MAHWDLRVSEHSPHWDLRSHEPREDWFPVVLRFLVTSSVHISLCPENGFLFPRHRFPSPGLPYGSPTNVTHWALIHPGTSGSCTSLLLAWIKDPSKVSLIIQVNPTFVGSLSFFLSDIFKEEESSSVASGLKLNTTASWVKLLVSEIILGRFKGVHYVKVCQVTVLLESDIFIFCQGTCHTLTYKERKEAFLGGDCTSAALHFSVCQDPLCTAHVHYLALGVIQWITEVKGLEPD